MFCYTTGGCEIPKGNILFIGDSITNDGRYVSLINTFFRVFLPEEPVSIQNIGVSSETLSGLSELDHPFPRPCVFGRLERVLTAMKPSWVVISYGVNDGIYAPFNEDYFEKFKEGCVRIINEVHSFGAKAVLLTPPPFDTTSFVAGGGKLVGAKSGNFSYMAPYESYNDVMERYARWMLDDLKTKADLVINTYDALVYDRKILRAAAPACTVGDGIHPDLHGHFTLAKAVLREMFGFFAESFEAVMSADKFKLFEQVYACDSLIHAYNKETIGHDNAFKDKFLPKEELKIAVKKAGVEISHYISEHSELTHQLGSWNGFKKHIFNFEGHEAIIVLPDTPVGGNPWVWRTEFFDAFAYADLAMVQNGWHLVFLSMPNRYGSPGAVELMVRFRAYVQGLFKLSEKAVMFGFSRGGLYAMNYAAREPERVLALYLDAPVLDIESWPMGKGKGCGSAADTYMCLRAFGLSEETAGSYKDILSKAIKNVTAAKIPLIIVAGDSDEVVPYEENGAIAAAAWERDALPFKLILKRGVGHHPHSLEDPAEIVSFLLEDLGRS